MTTWANKPDKSLQPMPTLAFDSFSFHFEINITTVQANHPLQSTLDLVR